MKHPARLDEDRLGLGVFRGIGRGLIEAWRAELWKVGVPQAFSAVSAAASLKRRADRVEHAPIGAVFRGIGRGLIEASVATVDGWTADAERFPRYRPRPH